jgi:hypothetical protein
METIVRYGSELEAEATKTAGGLVSKPGHEEQPKWVAKPGAVDPNRRGKRKNYPHKIEFEVEDSTTDWLKQYEIKSNEPDRYAVPASEISRFNARVLSVKIEKR